MKTRMRLLSILSSMILESLTFAKNIKNQLQKTLSIQQINSKLNTTSSIQAFIIPGIVTSKFYSPQIFNVSNDDLSVSDNVNMVTVQEDAWTGVCDLSHTLR